MARRAYEQYCGLAKALDLVGERWTLLIVRDLALGPRRYSDLLDGLPGIGTSMLADRLRHLEDERLVQRAQLPPPAAVAVYELTEDGDALVEAMLPLAVWGAGRLGFDDANALQRPEWLLLALRARFRADRAANVWETYEFRVDGFTMHAVVEDGAIDVRRGPAPGRPDLTVTADTRTLLDLGVGRVTGREAVREGRAAFDGSREASARCQALFGV